MIQRNINELQLRNNILMGLYKIIGESLRNEDYAFTGGYVLASKLPNVRRTHDIDLSILSPDTFELALSPILMYLENLKNQGKIYSYTHKPPVVGKVLRSGSIKIYIKVHDNARKKFLCGVDFAVNETRYGCTLTPKGYKEFCPEVMLADKVSGLYKDIDTLLVRIRDVFDIYLINTYLCVYNFRYSIFFKRLEERSIDIRNLTTLECAIKRKDLNRVNSQLSLLMNGGERLNTGLLKNENITCSVVIGDVIELLDCLRRMQWS